MSPSASLIDRIESIPRRELYFFALYRTLVASLFAALLFGPLDMFVGEAHVPALAHVVSVAYLVVDVRAGEARGAKLFEWSGEEFVCSREFPGSP